MAYRRAHPRSAPFLALTNFSDVTQAVDAGIIARAGLYEPAHVHSSTGQLSISAAPGSNWRRRASCAHRHLKRGAVFTAAKACNWPITHRECPV
jgi:hypothetical protein